MATICSCNNTTAASTPTSSPSSLVSSTCGTNCHQTQWGLHRSICSRTDSPLSRCVKPLYWTMFYQHFTMHCFYQFLLISSIFTRILSLAHLFYAYFTHGPNKSASAQYDNTRGAWLTQEGCPLTERKEGRKVYPALTRYLSILERCSSPVIRMLAYHAARPGCDRARVQFKGVNV